MREKDPHHRAYIQATMNNTRVTVTDSNGNCIAALTAVRYPSRHNTLPCTCLSCLCTHKHRPPLQGGAGFKGSKKSTPLAAQTCAERASQVGRIEPLLAVLFNPQSSGDHVTVRIRLRRLEQREYPPFASCSKASDPAVR